VFTARYGLELHIYKILHFFRTYTLPCIMTHFHSFSHFTSLYKETENTMRYFIYILRRCLRCQHSVCCHAVRTWRPCSLHFCSCCIYVRASKLNHRLRCFPQFLQTNDRALPHVEARPHPSSRFSKNYSLFGIR